MALINHISKVHQRIGSLVGFGRRDRVVRSLDKNGKVIAGSESVEVCLYVRTLEQGISLSAEQLRQIGTMATKAKQNGMSTEYEAICDAIEAQNATLAQQNAQMEEQNANLRKQTAK